MIKAVIFDLDGTLSDTLSTIAHFGNLSLNFYGYPSIETKEFGYFAGNGKKLLIKRMLEYSKITDPEISRKIEEKYDYEYEKDVLFDTKPFEGIPEVLEKLKNRGTKLAVLSNKPDNVMTPGVKKLYGDIFDECMGKIDGIPAKPDATSVKMLMDKMNVTADECVFIGDTYVDIETAKNSNMKSIGVLWGFRDYEELKNAGADYIISKPEQIYETILKIENEI